MKSFFKKLGILIIDAILTGICLCVFALFHHVMPREMSSAKILIDNHDNICSCQDETKFSCSLIKNDKEYKSENISVSLETKTMKVQNNNDVIYHVADIYVKNIESFKTAFAKGKYGKGYNDWMKNIASSNDAIIAINGDYYGMMPSGIIIRNGEVYRTSLNNADIGVLYKNGELKTYHAKDFNYDDAIKNGAWQAWQFGPMLLDYDGSATADFVGTTVTPRNPRTAIGYISSGHYVFVVVEGRSKNSVGLTMEQLSTLMYDLGCKSAYNLDGGQSSTLYFNGNIINNFPDNEGERTLGDIIYIGEVD